MTMTQIAPPPAQNAPYPPQPPRSNRGLLIALVALAVAILIAVTVGITLLLTRTGGIQEAPAAISAAEATKAPPMDSTDPVGEVPADLKLRGPLTSPYTVCVVTKGVAAKQPTFPIPVAYDATTVETAQAGRAQLVGLAAQISPSTASPVGVALQRWIATGGGYLQAVISRSGSEKLTALDKADGAAAESLNNACRTVGVG